MAMEAKDSSAATSVSARSPPTSPRRRDGRPTSPSLRSASDTAQHSAPSRKLTNGAVKSIASQLDKLPLPAPNAGALQATLARAQAYTRLIERMMGRRLPSLMRFVLLVCLLGPAFATALAARVASFGFDMTEPAQAVEAPPLDDLDEATPSAIEMEGLAREALVTSHTRERTQLLTALQENAKALSAQRQVVADQESALATVQSAMAQARLGCEKEKALLVAEQKNKLEQVRREADAAGQNQEQELQTMRGKLQERDALLKDALHQSEESEATCASIKEQADGLLPKLKELSASHDRLEQKLQQRAREFEEAWQVRVSESQRELEQARAQADRQAKESAAVVEKAHTDARQQTQNMAAALQEAREQAERDLTKAHADLADARKQAKAAQEASEQAQKELETVRGSEQQVKQDLEASRRQAQTEAKRVTSELAASKEQAQQSQESLEKLKLELNQAQAEAKEVAERGKAELEQVRGQEEKRKQDLAAAHQEADQFKAELTMVREQAQLEMKQTQRELDEAQARLKHQADEAAETLGKTRQELQQLQKVLNDTHAHAKQQADEAAATLFKTREEAQQLQKTLDQEHSHAKQQADEAAATLAKTQEETQQLQKTLDQERTHAKHQADEAAATLAKTRDEAQQAAKLLDETRQQFAGELERAKTERAALQSKLDAETQRLKQLVEGAEKQLYEQRSGASDAQVALTRAQSKSLKHAKTLEAQIATLEQMHQKSMDEQGNFQQQMESLKTQLKDASAQAIEKQTLATDVQKELAAVQLHSKESAGKQQTLEKQVGLLREEVTRHEAAENERAALVEELNVTKQQLVKVRAQGENLRAQLAKQLDNKQALRTLGATHSRTASTMSEADQDDMAAERQSLALEREKLKRISSTFEQRDLGGRRRTSTQGSHSTTAPPGTRGGAEPMPGSPARSTTGGEQRSRPGSSRYEAITDAYVDIELLKQTHRAEKNELLQTIEKLRHQQQGEGKVQPTVAVSPDVVQSTPAQSPTASVKSKPAILKRSSTLKHLFKKGDKEGNK